MHDEPKLNFSVVGAMSGLTWRCRLDEVAGEFSLDIAVSSGGGVKSRSIRTCFGGLEHENDVQWKECYLAGNDVEGDGLVDTCAHVAGMQ